MADERDFKEDVNTELRQGFESLGFKTSDASHPMDILRNEMLNKMQNGMETDLRLECVKQAVLMGSTHTEPVLFKAKVLFTYITTGK